MSARGKTKPGQLPSAWTLLRDVLSFLGGWVLIFMEVSRPEVRESVLILAASLVTVPGIGVGAVSLVEAARRDGTGSRPSQPPVEVPSQLL